MIKFVYLIDNAEISDSSHFQKVAHYKEEGVRILIILSSLKLESLLRNARLHIQLIAEKQSVRDGCVSVVSAIATAAALSQTE